MYKSLSSSLFAYLSTISCWWPAYFLGSLCLRASHLHVNIFSVSLILVLLQDMYVYVCAVLYIYGNVHGDYNEKIHEFL